MIQFLKLGGFHGRTFAAQALTHNHYIVKIDLPSLPWPIAPFPQYIYPLDKHEKENKEEDARCIQRVNSSFRKLSIRSIALINKIYMVILIER